MDPKPVKSLKKRLHKLTEQGGWIWTKNNTLKRVAIIGPDTHGIWSYHNTNTIDLDCNYYKDIFFHIATEEKLIHSRCHECFKVVIMPRTIEELMALEEYQKSIDVPCKCGIETREYVGRNYGGYFYTEGREQGRERREQVAKWARMQHAESLDDPEWRMHFPEPMKVILKRGCTEMERSLGPSHLWEIPEGQLEIQKELEDTLEYDKNVLDMAEMPQHILDDTYLNWIYYAFHVADPTYLKFTKDQPLFPAPVTYHDGDPREEDNDTGEETTVKREVNSSDADGAQDDPKP